MKPPSLARALAWLLPLGAGAVLRLFNLDRQVLLDDEMHTVGTALYVTLRDILSSFKSEDPCLPLAAFYRALLEAGLPFSEMTFRLPIVAVSLGSIVVLPLLALPAIGRPAAILFAWLLALSPVLAIYAGMVRPYGVVALLAPAATFTVLRWRDGGGLGWGLAYAVVAALGFWFHLGAAPVLAAPFGLLVLETVLRSTRKSRTRVRGGDRAARPACALPSRRELGTVAAVGLLLVAAFIVPASESLQVLYAVKSGIAPFSFELVPPIARLQSGVAVGAFQVPMAVLFWSLAAAGVAVVARSRRRAAALAAYVVGATLAQWVGLAILAPIGLLNPIIFNRYLIGTLPLVLVLVAVGLTALSDRVAGAWSPIRAAVDPLESRDTTTRRGSSVTAAWVAVPAIVCGLLAAAGPYADPVFRRTSFRHSKDFIRFDLPRGHLDAAAVPSFYRSDEVHRADAPIVEFPFRGGWSATRTHYIYQSIHGRPVLAAEPHGWPCDARLRLRNHVCAEPDRIVESAARFMVLHRDPLAEELLMLGGDDSGNRYNPEEWEQFARTASRVARDLRRRWGPPLHRDQRVVVWDLEAVRSARAAEAR